MILNESIKRGIYFITGTLFGLVMCVVFLYTTTVIDATEPQPSDLGYSVYVNGEEITLNDTFIKDGRTYVQLRELCTQMNVTVEWNDPRHEIMPLPGGNSYHGINLTNPTFVYTDEVIDFNNSAKKLMGVDITGIYDKYNFGSYKPELNDYTLNNFNYAFGTEGLVVKEKGIENIIPLNYIANNGQMYLSVDEFREKVQPYLVDMCLQ